MYNKKPVVVDRYTCLWAGSWKSSVEPTKYFGTIYFELNCPLGRWLSSDYSDKPRLPFHIIDDFKFQVKETVVLEYEGPYRNNEREFFPGKYICGHGPETTSTSTDLKFIGTSDKGQTLLLNIPVLNPTVLKGTFTTIQPYDLGSFELRPPADTRQNGYLITSTTDGKEIEAMTAMMDMGGVNRESGSSNFGAITASVNPAPNSQ